MEPSASATWTASGMFAGALKAALLLGLVSETLGRAFTVIETGSERSVSPLSFFAQAAETGPNNPSVTRTSATEAFAPIDPPPEGLRKLDSNAYARRSGDLKAIAAP